MSHQSRLMEDVSNAIVTVSTPPDVKLYNQVKEVFNVAVHPSLRWRYVAAEPIVEDVSNAVFTVSTPPDVELYSRE
ncbi:hypothetical protein HID58_037960 [Brassica napus]|uniref:Uncharacterized protein n=1 Tax=Brassica napus TaxID=3708 RepID=A0ABQ8BMW1_BRANA|nr:hypothetical protein HID58_037960 [Brassica napus]